MGKSRTTDKRSIFSYKGQRSHEEISSLLSLTLSILYFFFPPLPLSILLFGVGRSGSLSKILLPSGSVKSILKRSDGIVATSTDTTSCSQKDGSKVQQLGSQLQHDPMKTNVSITPPHVQTSKCLNNHNNEDKSGSTKSSLTVTLTSASPEAPSRRSSATDPS